MMNKINRTERMDRNRAMLLNKISKTGFMLGDLHLYLDTHPACMNALRHYAYYQKQYTILVKEYESKYGPLTPKLTEGATRWNWIDGPWPWENEANEL
jgi:spore coat protein JB